jgi:sterol desaturase/sphingolipid hydroxylase (fatty acid hydroxylase superfamily)
MHDLLSKIPMSYFLTACISFVFGIMTSWRFARYVERMRDAVRHAKHHYARALDFVSDVRNNIAGLALTAAFFGLIAVGIGWMVVVRITG